MAWVADKFLFSYPESVMRIDTGEPDDCTYQRQAERITRIHHAKQKISEAPRPLALHGYIGKKDPAFINYRLH